MDGGSVVEDEVNSGASTQVGEESGSDGPLPGPRRYFARGETVALVAFDGLASRPLASLLAPPTLPHPPHNHFSCTQAHQIIALHRTDSFFLFLKSFGRDGATVGPNRWTMSPLPRSSGVPCASFAGTERTNAVTRDATCSTYTVYLELY